MIGQIESTQRERLRELYKDAGGIHSRIWMMKYLTPIIQTALDDCPIWINEGAIDRIELRIRGSVGDADQEVCVFTVDDKKARHRSITRDDNE